MSKPKLRHFNETEVMCGYEYTRVICRIPAVPKQQAAIAWLMY